jgi:hypothetical protein
VYFLIKGEVMFNILEITQVPEDGDSKFWLEGLGWYFSDEACILCGPYDTEQLAEEALLEYCRHL